MTIEQDFVVSLAAGHVRHVRTPEGAKFYGLPVGSPITADIIAAKKAEGLAKGLKAPAGALTKNPAKVGSQPGGGKLSPHAKVPDAPKAKAPKAPKPPKVSKPTLKGNQHFKVGKSEYTAPAGSILVKPKGTDNVAFVRTPDGKVHAFTEAGQVEIPKELEKPFSEKFVEGFQGDENFDVVPFDKASASFGIEQMKPGDSLVDARGQVVFTKNNDGSWKHATFGINLSEDDIKPMYDSGELTPEQTDTAKAAEQAFSGNENLNFADMSADELQKTLDGLPEGFNLELGTGDGKANLTKQPDGSWKSDLTDKNLDPQSLYYVKTQLNVGKSAPDAAKEKLQAAEPNPLDANATGAAPTPPGKGETPNADWIKTAPPGSSFIYHGAQKDTTWENVDGTWYPNGNTDVAGGGYDSSEIGNLLATANDADLEIQKVGKPPKDEKKIGKLGATPVDQIGKPKQDDSPLADWEKELLTLPEDKPKTPPAPVIKKPNEQTLASEDTSIGHMDLLEHLNELPVGQEIYSEAGTKLTKNQNGTWKSEATGFDIPAVDLSLFQNYTADVKKVEAKKQAEADYQQKMDDLLSHVKNAAPGDTVHQGDVMWTKGEGEKWMLSDAPGSDYHMSEADLVSEINIEGPDKFQIGQSEQKDIQAVMDQPDAPEPFKVGEKVAADHFIDKAQVGESFKLEGSSFIWTKTGDNQWENGSSTATDEMVKMGHLGDEVTVVDSAEGMKKGAGLPAVGDSIHTFEAVDALPPKTQLSYIKKNGQESVYTKLDNGLLLSPHGGQYTAEQLKNSVLGGKFTVKSYPDVVDAPKTPESVSKVYAPNDQIEKYGHLRDMPVGTKIKDAGGPNYEGIELTKQDDGTWLVTNKQSGELQNHVYSPDELANAVKDKYIFFKSAPDTTDKTATVEVKDTKVFPGSESYSVDEIKQAVDALEAHTGFQISYGFKSIPDHPFANKETQDKIKVEALQKYPDMKPKAAFVQYLKDKAGISSEDSKEVKKLDNGAKVNIGSGTPKNTSGGMDGGEFSQHDIAEAIDILENYDGKIFKNELNKKGNPLGVLNPVTIVGFDKDKLVTKQKFIDLLKQKLQDLNEPDVHGTKVNDLDELSAFPTGTKLDWHNTENGVTDVFTKLGPDNWESENHKTSVGDWTFHGGLTKGYVSVQSVPKGAPDYATPPAAVQAVSDDPALDDHLNEADIPSAPVGAVYVHKDGDYFYTKINDKQWMAADPKSGEFYATFNEDTMAKFIKDGAVVQHKVDGPDFNESGVTPGKYSSGGKAHMYVFADGSGVYVSGTGNVSALTPEKIKKNFEAGVNLYIGLPDNAPAVPAPAPKKKVEKVEDLADGTYFAGNPASTKAAVYKVEGADAQVWKPKTSTEGVNAKVGSMTTGDWMDNASVGAQFKYVPYNMKYTDKQGNLPAENYYTKQEDGSWVNGLGTKADDYIINDAKGHWSDSKIVSHGMGDPAKITKAKLQTLYAKGELTDANGNSIVPDGYSGSVYFFGGQTNIPSLVELKKFVETATSDDIATINQKAKQLGIYADPKLTSPYLKKHYTNSEGVIDNESRLQFWKDALENATTGVDTSIPDAPDVTQYFEWDDLGNPVYPAELTNLPLYTTGDYSNFIKTASAKIGDGKIIGQHYTKMNKQQKASWVQAFKNGNFKGMYAIEVQAAAADNKAHNSGFKHPGYEGNEKTNNLTWGAAVKGEIPAGTAIEGNWSSIGIEPSMEEINNYIIKAQMQNPTFLSNSEKRQWVKYHRHGAGYKTNVDQLSVTALNRKNSGMEPLSDPVAWTDDVQPAKSYTKFFDDEKFPVSPWTSYAGGQAAVDYMADNPDNAKLKQAYDDIYTKTYGVEEHGYDNPYIAKQAVSGYFTDLAEEEYQKSLIPVYTLKPNQTVKKSTHPVFQYTDQWGNEYFFKPRPNTKLDKYRSEVEHLGNQFGKLFGFQTADSKLVTIDGKYGQLQKDVGGVSDLMGADYSQLTDVQIADIGSEHLLDAFLDNDDTKGDNAKILPSGRIVGIDKGRAFKHFGGWSAFSADSSMNSNAQTIYAQLYDTIRAGKIDKETLDKAYLAIQKKAEKMAKVSDQTITDMLKEGMVNREVFDNSYKINGKKVPNTLEGLTAAVLDRKNNLPELTREMWAKIYKDAGYGDLPEKPKSPLGDVISGLDHDQLHEEVFKAEATGKTAMIGGSHVIGGTALVWTDKYADGSTNLNGEMFLGPKKQKEVLDYLIQNATDMSHASASEVSFGDYDTYGQKIIDAAKTINHHAVDKAYNGDKIAAFEQASQNIETELNEWAPNLESNTKFNGIDAYKFSTGTVVPMQHIDQYKLMLDKYWDDAQEVAKAKSNEGKTGVISAYQPLTLSPQAEKWVSPDGNASFTKLANGKYLKTFRQGKVEVSDMSADDIAKMEAYGWQKVKSEKATETAGIKIVKMAKTHEKSAKTDGHTKTITGTTGGINGSSGQEYEVTLPTGEKIYFRNAGNTNTKRGQHGKLTFRAEGVEDSTASKAAMERIQAQLEAMGISTDAADHDNAELTYWREMYGILENRKHAAGSNYAKAKAKLDAKVKEIGGDPNEFLENLSEKLPPEAENAFWRELYSEFWPDKVQKLINEEGYLPKFDHQNLANPELETGKPYWERFDIDLEEIYAKDMWLMSATGGEPNPMIYTGGALSAEERLRQLDQFDAAGSWSASSDQSYGSSHNIYTRVNKASEAKSFNAFYDPRMMLRTRTYSFNGDNYGNLDNRKSSSPSNPLDVLAKFGGGSNETMLPHAATLLDGVEIYAFDYAEKRNEAIQHLKKMGIEMIRGLPIEDRLVMREKVQDAIAKVKATWQAKS